MNLPELRENYTMSGLKVADVNLDPIQQFEHWMTQALEAELFEPNAMTLSTANAKGVVSSRTVLLKGLENGRFQFFTNYQSRKAQDLEENPHASVTFLWKELERQICIRGTVTKTSREVSEAYFHSRPYGSQIGAWVSEKQSHSVPVRAYLEKKEVQMRERFPDSSPVPLPEFWGGYALKPTYIEFWQGRPCRLHDRIVYTLVDEKWRIARLSP